MAFTMKPFNDRKPTLKSVSSVSPGNTFSQPFKAGSTINGGSMRKTSSIGGNTMTTPHYPRLGGLESIPIEDGFDKVAASFVNNILNSPATSAAVASIAAGAGLAGMGAGIDYVSSVYNERKYEKALQAAIQMSPVLQGHGYNTLRPYMRMIAKASPTVAEEPLLLANYLESMLDAQGHMNLATFAELSGLEGNILKNNDYNNKWRYKMLEGAGKVVADSAGAATRNYVTGRLEDATNSHFTSRYGPAI